MLGVRARIRISLLPSFFGAHSSLPERVSQRAVDVDEFAHPSAMPLDVFARSRPWLRSARGRLQWVEKQVMVNQLLLSSKSFENFILAVLEE